MYDESFGAPFCVFIGNECSSMDLLNGRGTMEGGHEPNPSNTSFQPSTSPSLTPTKRLSTSPSESPSKRPVLSAFDVDADNNKKRAMRWCQGTVMHVFDDVRVPTVKVEWDSIPDAEGYEETTVSNQRLLTFNFNHG